MRSGTRLRIALACSVIAACLSTMGPGSATAASNPSRVLDGAVGGIRRTAGFGASVAFGPCTLYPSFIHFRKTPPPGIGPKPYTDCDGVRVTSIHQETKLEYEWYAWWRQALVVSGGNTGQSRYTQRRVDFKCLSSESTVWGATTLGTVVYRGKTYHARVYQKMRRLPCGA